MTSLFIKFQNCKLHKHRNCIDKANGILYDEIAIFQPIYCNVIIRKYLECLIENSIIVHVLSILI